MTSPQDPYGHDPFSYDPLGRVPYLEPPAPPPVLPFPSEPPHRPSVNTLATLSLVFAFVFAPVGAVLGHLGLAQIRRTGERGRDRAVAGVTLSYLFIAITVVAVVASVILAAVRSPSPRVAAPPPTAAGPPPPTVEPGTLATLLPSLDALKTITADENLEAGPTRDRATRSEKDGAVDRAECWGSVAAGTPDAFPSDATTGYRAAKFTDTRSLFKSLEVLVALIAFRDPPAAAAQLATVLSGWRQCGGTTVNVTLPGVGPMPYALSAPTDAGNGITTMDLTPKGLQVRCAHAIAAKSNVVADLSVCSAGTADAARPRETAVSVANSILAKLPG